MAPTTDCEVCGQSGRTKFYCQNCLKERLRIHHEAVKRLDTAHAHTTFRASALMNNPDGPRSLAVKGLKAERYDLRERGKQKQAETFRLKEEIEVQKAQRDERKARLRARRERLNQAKSRLELLSSDRALSDTLPPDAVASLRTRISSLVREWDAVLAALVKIRRVLIAELLHVFPITRAPQFPRSDLSSIKSPSTSVREKGKSKARFPFQSMTAPTPEKARRQMDEAELRVSGIPLPAAAVESIKGHRADELSAAVSHAAHVLRLIALYLGVKLPFQLVLGPRPGIRPITGSVWTAKFSAKKSPYPLFLSPSDSSAPGSSSSSASKRSTRGCSSSQTAFLTGLSMLSWTSLYLLTSQTASKLSDASPASQGKANSSPLAYILATVASRHLGVQSHVTASGSQEFTLARPEGATIEGADLAVWVDQALATGGEEHAGSKAKRDVGTDNSQEDEGWSLL